MMENKGKLYLMMGISGAGKSTWLSHNAKDGEVIVSRDQIRFGMLQNGDDYFDHEDEVFDTFITTIQTNLQQGKTVYADATHLTKKGRAKVLHRVSMFAEEIGVVWIKVSLSTALKQNAQRSGLACVPSYVIRRMLDTLEAPIKEEGFDTIIIIDERRR